MGLGAVVAVAVLALPRLLRRTSSSPVVPAESPLVPRPLANDAADESCPSLSPDGRRVVYFWSRDDDPGLYIKPVSGGQPQRLATGDVSDFGYCGYARWSPAGDLIAFLSHEDSGAKAIWVVS